MLMEVLIEILAEIFIDFLFYRLIRPFFRVIGALLRWIYRLGKVPFSIIYKKDYNTRIGVVVSIITVLSLYLLLN